METYDEMSIVLDNMMLATATISAVEIQLFIDNLVALGATEQTISVLLMTDLAEGGRLFGAVSNRMKNTVRDGIGMAGNIGSYKHYESEGVEEFVWITVNGRQACPDCQDREGRTGTMEYFMSIGEPRSGWSICGHHCQCQLEPNGKYDGKTLITRDTKGKV
tara:strand:- start:4964 stop:5449 length:486 start_codon:yes stop_codon:yes gene_type:complete